MVIKEILWIHLSQENTLGDNLQAVGTIIEQDTSVSTTSMNFMIQTKTIAARLLNQSYP